MPYEFITYEVKASIAYVTLNRPDVMNAAHPPMRRELGQAFRAFEEDESARVAILRGEGRAFCAGVDLRYRSEEGDAFTSRENELLTPISPERWITKPIIAAVHGYAFGMGLELTLACDLAVAAEGAEFGLLEVRNGRVAGTGIQRIVRQIPMKHALGVVLTGRRVPAEEAQAIGLVNEVVPEDDLLSSAERWAREIIEAAPLAVTGSKQAAYAGLEYSTLVEAAEAEYPLAEKARNSEDTQEAMRAFAERRKPEWKGR